VSMKSTEHIGSDTVMVIQIAHNVFPFESIHF
jgi:hypothetical protein